MYCNHFQLRRLPFEERANTRFYFGTSDTDEALASMEYAAHYGQGIALVLGASGTGKTLLGRMLHTRLAKSDQVVLLTIPTGGRVNLIREVAKGFGVALGSSWHSSRLLDRLRRHLRRSRKTNSRAVLVIDQAEELTPEMLVDVAALHELQCQAGHLLQMILLGRPQIMEQLQHPRFERLHQRVFGERHLKQLTLGETAGYIAHRLQLAGAEGRVLFTEEAVQLVQEHSRGNPRRINQICNAALVAAFGAGMQVVEGSTVAEVAGAPAPAVEREDVNINDATALAPTVESESPAEESITERVVEKVTEQPAGAFSPEAGAAIEGRRPRDAQRATTEERIEQLCGRLEAQLESTESRVIQAEERLRTLGAQSEAQLQAAEARVARLERLVQEPDERLTRMEQAYIRADEVKTQIGAFASDLAGRIEQTQEKISLLMTTLEAGDAAYDRLESIAREVSALTSSAEAEVDAQRARLRDAVEDAGQMREQFPSGALERIERRTVELIEEMQGRLPGMVDEATATIQTRAQELRETVQEAKRTTEIVAQESANALRVCREEAEQDLRSTRSKVTQLEATVETLAQRAGELKEDVEGLSESVENTAAGADKVSGVVQQAGRDLNDIKKQTGNLFTELASSTRHSEETVTQARKATERLEVLQRTTNENIARADSACARTGDLERLATGCERLYTDMTAERELADQTNAELKQQAIQSKELREVMGSEVAGVRETCAEVQAARAAAGATLAQLRQENETGDQLTRKLDDASAALADQFKSVSAGREAVEAALRQVRTVSGEAKAQSAELQTLRDDSAVQMQALNEAVTAAGAERESAEAVAEQLRDILSGTAETREAMEQTLAEIDRNSARLGVRVAGAVQRFEEGAQRVQADTEASLKQSGVRVAGEVQQLAERVQQLQADTEASLKQSGVRVAGEVQQLAERVQHLQADTEAKLNQCGARIAVAGEEASKLVDDKKREIAAHAGELESKLEQTGAQLKSLAQEKTGVLRAYTDKITEQVHQSTGRAVALAVDETAKLNSQLVAITKETEDRIAVLRVQSKQLAEVGAQATDITACLQQTISETEEQQEACTKAAQNLGGTIDGARQLHETVRRELLEADEKISQLDSHHAAARSIAQRLGEANIEAHRLVESIDEHGATLEQQFTRATHVSGEFGTIIEQVERATELAGDRHEQLGDLLAQAEPGLARAQQLMADLVIRQQEAAATCERLEERRQAAAEIHSGLELANEQCNVALELSGGYRNEVIALSATMAEQLTTLRELMAQAHTHQAALAETHGTVEALVTRVETARGQTQASEAQMAQRTQAAAALAETAEKRIAQLATDSAQVEGLIRQLQEATAPAGQLIDSLQQIVVQAQTQSDALQSGCGKAAQLATQVSAVTQALTAARATGTELEKLVDEARTQQRNLTVAAAAAAEGREALAQVEASARKHQETQVELEQRNQLAAELSTQLGDKVKRAEEMETRLRRQHDTIEQALNDPEGTIAELVRHTEALDSSQRMLNEFVAQGRTLAEDIASLRVQTEQINTIITDLMDKPGVLVHKAQEQAAHLERVCGAVRKVFSGLSQAALHSNKQTEEFKVASRETMERLARLKTETKQASVTLNEWVDEARRVQTRLERTLSVAPSLAQTHSMENLFRLSNLPGGTTPPRETGPYARTSEQSEESPVTSRSRAEEIAEMLENTKATEPLVRS